MNENIMEDEELDLKLNSIWKDYPTTPSPTSTSSIKSFDGKLLNYNSYKSSSVASIFGGKQDFGGNPASSSVTSPTYKQILHPPKFIGHVNHSPPCMQNQQYITNCFPSSSSSTYGYCNHHPIHHYYNHMKRNANFEFHQLSRSSSQSSGFASYNNCTPSLCAAGGFGASDPQQFNHYHRCNKNIYENMIYQEDNMINFDASLNRSFNIKNSNIRASTPLNSTSSSIGKSSSSKTCHTNSSRKLRDGEVGRFGASKSLQNSPENKFACGNNFSSDESESDYNEDVRETIKKSSKYTEEACKNIESDQDQDSSTFLTSFTSSLKLKSSSSRKHKGKKTRDTKDKNITRMKKVKKVKIDIDSGSSAGFIKNFLQTLFFPMSIFLNIILLLLICCLVFNEQLNLKKLCFSILHISFEYFKKLFPFDLPTPFYSQNSTADYYFDETF